MKTQQAQDSRSPLLLLLTHNELLGTLTTHPVPNHPMLDCPQVGLQALGPSALSTEGRTRLRAALSDAKGSEAKGAATPEGEAASGRLRGHEKAGDEDGREYGGVPRLTLEAFVGVYSRAAARLTASSMARQLEMGFDAFDRDHDGSVTPEELRAGLEAVATAPLNEARVAWLIDELDADASGDITLEEYVAWMLKTYSATLSPGVLR